jgi:hypothetical protein
MKSRIAFYLSSALILLSAFFYYPKWRETQTEATIGWDVSGYYMYLPAALIYGDLKEARFLDSVIQKYHPTPGILQGFRLPNGHFVMKYSIGQALQFLPWFTAAHLLAKPLGFPADGFSLPYQAAISWGSLLIALLGLWISRNNLLNYFSDRTTAITLLCLTFGTNYLNYTAFDGAMTHNWLFTAYSLIIFCTIRFYRNPSFLWAAAIGLLCGWATLTRPTEIISVLLPLLWGVGSVAALRERLHFFKIHFSKILTAVAVLALVGSIQFLYWKYVSGQWVIYSYEEQGFSWFKPHVQDVLLSYRAGWLTWSPMFIFAIFGFFALWRNQKDIAPGLLLFCLLFFYVASSWVIWWYGGSLGSRAMVQSYAAWIFPLAAGIQWIIARKWSQYIFVALSGLFIWANLWWTNQAHKGDGLFVSEQMTRRFYWQVIGKSELQREWLKLLDTKDYFYGTERKNVRTIFTKDFESDSTHTIAVDPINGKKSWMLDRDNQYTPEYELPIRPGEAKWLRTTVTIKADPKEWEFWRMTQMYVRFYNGDKKIKERMIRLHRHVDGNEIRTVFMDTQLPKWNFTRATVYLWHADGDKALRVDDLTAELFD